ncbi:hypothetical protein [Salibaculum griseiflavum]|uniref:hypothetical protein n=1 Tax=Salibaculum griseiflavum TaxID=1914409 RepID=UPI001C391EE9|nr:hypothetical protein [Salibaculum griseiflavum]
MTQLSKLSFKTVERASPAKDPVLERRNKLVAALDEQKLALAATLKGETHTKQHAKWITNEQGERLQAKTQRPVKPWFFEQDGGWYVQCRYGARVLLVDGKNNAAFVSKLEQVGSVLDAFRAAAQAGELDTAIARAAERKRTAK